MRVRTAFLLCAGWGQRLEPLTNQVPKPLVPVCGVPLCEFALARIAALGVERIVVNTHRLPAEFARLFPGHPAPARCGGAEVLFRHEPVLLETAGGLRNIADLLLPGAVLVHNGDILADLDLAALCAAHEAGGGLCTLALRSHGGPLQVGFDADAGLVTDIRGELGSNAPRLLFTGVSVVEPEFIARIPAGRPVSFVPVWLDLLREGGRIAGAVLDGGLWRDIGTVEEYRRIHADLATGAVRISPPPGAPHGWPVWHMPGASVDASAVLEDWNWIGPRASVGAGAYVSRTILWPGARVAPGARLRACIVREGCTAAGDLAGAVV